MLIIVLLISVSLTIAIVFLVIFYYSMKSGQYDDTYTPSVRMLFDDKKPAPPIDKNPSDTRQNNITESKK